MPKAATVERTEDLSTEMQLRALLMCEALRRTAKLLCDAGRQDESDGVLNAWMGMSTYALAELYGETRI